MPLVCIYNETAVYYAAFHNGAVVRQSVPPLQFTLAAFSRSSICLSRQAKWICFACSKNSLTLGGTSIHIAAMAVNTARPTSPWWFIMAQTSSQIDSDGISIQTRWCWVVGKEVAPHAETPIIFADRSTRISLLLALSCTPPPCENLWPLFVE